MSLVNQRIVEMSHKTQTIQDLMCDILTILGWNYSILISHYLHIPEDEEMASKHAAEDNYIILLLYDEAVAAHE